MGDTATKIVSDTASKIVNACSGLSEKNVDLLVHLYDSPILEGTEAGSPFRLDGITKISIEQGAALHALIADHQVVHSLEIGFAYGFSTVWMLDALRGKAGATHVAIDPFEKTAWQGIGLAQVGKVDTGAKFEWVPDYSIQAIPAMLKQKQRFDMAYIDGNHRFDDVLVDFYLVDQVMREGGLIVLDDMWMDSIKTVKDFILKNRAYELVANPVSNIAVLKKLRNDDRDWRHFVPFSVSVPKSESRKPRKNMLHRLFG